MDAMRAVAKAYQDRALQAFQVAGMGQVVCVGLGFWGAPGPTRATALAPPAALSTHKPYLGCGVRGVASGV